MTCGESSIGGAAPSRRRLTGVLLALAIGAMAWPVAAHGAQQIITSAGPLSQIFINDDLACQVQTSADQSPSFFGGTNPGGCGTFLALQGGANQALPANELFGPSVGPSVDSDFTPSQPQAFSGGGTAASPFQVTTDVDALNANGGSVAHITETDSYVVGQSSYDTVISVKAGRLPISGTLYHAGDCFLSNLDSGFGAFAANSGSPGSPMCTINANNSPPARIMSFTPVNPSANFIESQFNTVWSDITNAAPPFPNTVDATTNQDNGMGLSWSFSAGGGQTAQVHLTTTVSQFTAPVSSTTAGPCVANGQVPVTVSAANGATQVNFILDGGIAQSVPTDGAGNATISVPAGKHTLEFWGQDQTGNQESPHHVVPVTVEAGGPTVKISSDQGETSYEVGDHASVSISATGAGLSSDPSAVHVPISTAKPGNFSVQRTATDACGSATATFAYAVLAPPTLGKNVNVKPVSGFVFVKLPKGAHLSAAPASARARASVTKGVGFVPLTDARQIPLGSLLDTTGGAVQLTTATARRSTFQVANFSAGIFNILQPRKQRGLTTLNLTDAHSARSVCARVGKKAQAARLSRRVLGLLNGSGHGRFTTRGRYSAATVRGTVWTVSNRCDGTLTHVTRGVVVVRDFRRRKNITVRAGRSYLAKAPGA